MKVGFLSLGCKVNYYETEKMKQQFEEAGYQAVSFEEEADIYIINTCTVTNIADRKSRKMLHRARRNNRDAIVVAAGCYTDSARRKMDGIGKTGEKAGVEADLHTFVDLFIPNAEKDKLLEKVEILLQERQAAGLAAGTGKGEAAKKHTRAYIKVQDGCRQYCTYCIIPYVRGPLKSRAAKDVVKEAAQLAAEGVREVVITGIHLSSYGVDFTDKKSFTDLGGKLLLGLLSAVAEVEGIARIRLGSLEPRVITEGFVKELCRIPKVCPHFHLSLQSGCDATLGRMNRKYTCEEYEKGCRLLREYFSHPAITTDVIVGFPGETEEEFEATRKFLQKINFFEIHIFKYSLRKGTKAAQMERQIPEGTKNIRSDLLFEDLSAMNREYLEWHIGRELEVLMEEEVFFGGKRYVLGHTREYVKAAVPLPEEGGERLENKLVRGTAVSVLKEHILLLQNFSIFLK